MSTFSGVTGTIAERFALAWAAQPGGGAGADPHLLPSALAGACAQVLPVAGAGLSVFMDGERLPIGASTEVVTLAERLQFVHGAGPCFEAARGGGVEVFEAEEMQRRWPLFATQLFEQTPYRAIISSPVRLAENSRAALDLYLRVDDDLLGVSVVALSTVVKQMRYALLTARVAADLDPLDTDDAALTFLDSDVARARTAVWLGVGLLMQKAVLSARDALDVLRAYAFGHRTTVDEVAADLVSGRLPVERLAG